jgi:hypothetical protein
VILAERKCALSLGCRIAHIFYLRAKDMGGFRHESRRTRLDLSFRRGFALELRP